GFQNVTLNQSAAEAQIAANQAPEPAAAPENATASEAFVVNGSLTQGLSQARPEDTFARGLEAGNGQQNPFGEGGARSAQAGPGGFGGGRGGGGFGGGGGGFGGGGRGGPGGQRQRGPRPGTNANFGNRSARNRNALRGAAFFTIGNSALNARQYSLTGQDVLKPSYGSARFGLSAGGALNIPHVIHSDQTFFFLNYSGARSRAPYDAFATLPTDRERAGDFSQSVTTAPVTIYDPRTNQPFPGNVIPTSRLDPTALRLLSYIPRANQPGTVQNYQIVESVPQNTDNLNLRINRPLTKKDQLNANINLQNRDARTAQLFGYSDRVTGFGLSSSVGWTHTFGARLLNNLTVNFSRNRNTTDAAFSYGPDVAALVGINGTSRDPINFGPPNLTFTNYGGLNDASPVLSRNQTAGLSDGLTIVRGRHTFVTGGEYRRQQFNLRTDSNARGTYSFSGLLTSAFDASGQPLPNTGYDFADYLLGLPQSSSVRFGTNSNYFRGSVYNAYVTDDWKVRPNLTFNLGVRYEYFTPFHEKYGHIANLDIAPGFTGVAVVTPGAIGPYTGKFPDGLINPEKNNFSPRLATAWRPWAKKQTLIRAGYSIFYNGAIYTQFVNRLASQPPFAKSAALTTSLAQPLTIENGFALTPAESITNTYAIDKNYRLGYIQTWNVSVQQTLPHALVLELGYLGTKGTRLDIQRLPNRSAPGSPLTSEQRRQIGNAVGFTYDTSDGNSIYHALQVRFTRRFSRGISANALYTFSKSIDDASTIGNGGTVVAQNDQDISAERGLSSFDQRHVLNLFFIYSSPFGENGVIKTSGWKDKLLKDWQFTGGVNAASGLPFTARVLGNLSNVGGTGAVGSGRANATGLPISSGVGLFNLAAFTIPQAGQYGNAGRNTIIGPSRLTMNLGFGRSFRVHDDRKRLEIRIESNNLTNSPNIVSFNTVVNASNYGLPLAVNGMRTVTATARLRF
ncbi:MAG: TonB-dependent receptor, partial [Acidobacteriota bacterium]|nr:TonB-dependent receptor [Acidobacteriota bacterium]